MKDAINTSLLADVSAVYEKKLQDNYRLSVLIKNLEYAILLEDENRRIVLINQKFCDLFHIPVDPELLTGSDCSQAAEQSKSLFLNPSDFVTGINELLAKKEKKLGETLRMADGKILLRDFIPIMKEGIYLGHMWTYADITNHTNSEELEIQQAINFFASSLYKKETVEEILWDVAKNCIGKLGFLDCVIYMVDDEKRALVQKAAWGLKMGVDNKILNPNEIPLGKGIAGTVAVTGLPQIIGDTSSDKRYIINTEACLSEIAVPIISDGNVLGVIDSEHPQKNFYTQKHLSALSAIASLCAVKIVQLRQEISREIELLKQKNFYEEILDNLPADIAVFDKAHHYLYVNPAGIKNADIRKWIIGKKDEDYCDLKGRSRDSLVGRRLLFNRVVSNKKQEEWEEVLYKNNGTPEYHLRKMYPVTGEGKEVKLVIGYGINITERKKIEDRIQQNEKKYKDLFNYSPALIFTHDMDFKITSVNDAVNEILGFSPGQVVGKKLNELAIGGTNDPTFLAYKAQITKQNNVKGVVPVINVHGELMHLLCHGYKVETQNEPAYVIAFGQDITDRIKAEDHLYKAKLLTEQTAKAKEAFIAKVSHEIRTPMSGIMAIAGLLGKTPMTQQQNKYLDVLQQSAQNLLLLINDVLDIEKISSGKMLLDEVSFNLQEKIEVLAEAFRANAVEKGLELKLINTVPPSCSFLGDPFRLTQILNNLLSNAIKFTDKGYVSVSVFMLSERNDECDIEFEISDTGIGIAEEKQDEIFQPFTQAHVNSDALTKGTGLGLTICKELVQLMKGVIQLSSRPGEGSVFKVIIPFKKNFKQAKQVISSQEKNYIKFKGKKILLAEDVALNHFLLKEITKSWQVELDIAVNGKEAYEKAQLITYDFILMDIQMPEMDGFEATRLIRELPGEHTKQVPIIALTANTFVDADVYKKEGFTDYLAKPFDEESLLEMFSRVVGNKALAINAGTGTKKKEKLPTQVSFDLTYLLKAGKGNKEFVQFMIRSFKDSTPGQLQDLKTAMERSDVSGIAGTAHKIKFSVNTMGLHQVKDDVLWIEEQARQNNMSAELKDKISNIITLFEELLKQEVEL
ncbi:MAG: PAS domain S-box protein [Bacteroidetes bacterium]|nr:PAS domain S-box protein [Bacteroidota bacterium]